MGLKERLKNKKLKLQNKLSKIVGKENKEMKISDPIFMGSSNENVGKDKWISPRRKEDFAIVMPPKELTRKSNIKKTNQIKDMNNLLK